jgi:hypothetical protein
MVTILWSLDVSRKAEAMKWTLRVGWALALVLSVPVIPHAAEPPKKDALPAVVELFEDDADVLIPQLNNVSGEAGDAKRDDAEKFSGLCSLRVTPLQRYTPSVNGWAYPVAEKPAAGQYRYLRFAWKKDGGQGIMLQLSGHAGGQDWGHRYVAGTPSVNWESLRVAEKMPAGWEVVTRDLFKDFGAFTVTGIAFTPMDGTAGYYDHLYLARTVEDLDRVTEAALGKNPPKEALAADKVKALWEDLATRDALLYAPAAAALAGRPKESVPFLKEALKPKEVGDDEKRIARLIADLDADEFAAREAATKELAKLGEAAVPALQRALKDNPSLEKASRIKTLLGDRLGGEEAPTGEQVRLVRAVRVLERANTPEAREVLGTLAKAGTGDRLGREAKEALRRLDKQR